MIQISIKHGGKWSLEANGHAGYNPGNDIVCSAVSCLLYSLAGYLANREDVESEAIIESGYARISVGCGADEALELVEIGLLQLERRYGDYIEILKKKGDDSNESE